MAGVRPGASPQDRLDPESRAAERHGETRHAGSGEGGSWFAVHCHAGKERTAESHLLRQGFGVFLPLLRCGEAKAARPRRVLAPLFPGYVFAGFDPRTAAWRRVNGTYGVKKLVSFGETPEPVPPAFMATLRQSCDEASVFSFRRAADFREGDRVKLAAGPFMGMIGEIAAMGGPDRAWLLLAILGRTTRVSVGLDELQKIA